MKTYNALIFLESKNETEIFEVEANSKSEAKAKANKIGKEVCISVKGAKKLYF